MLNPGETICELTASGDHADRKVLLVGDSHADALKQAFVEVCTRRRIGVYFYVANNSLLTSGIDEWSVYRDVKRLAVDAVVLHFSAAAYEGEMIQRITGLTRRLHAEGVGISIVGPVPIYDVHIPKYLYGKTVRTMPSIDLKLSNYYDKTKVFGRRWTCGCARGPTCMQQSIIFAQSSADWRIFPTGLIISMQPTSL